MEEEKEPPEIEGFEKVEVAGIFMAPERGGGTTPVVFLENKKGRVLPIYIGVSEAFSIQTALEKVPYPRPLTHDLLVTILEGLDSKLLKVLIDDLSDGIIFARMTISKNGGEFQFDARPSDSVALALRTKAPIYVSKKVMEEASVDKNSYRIGGGPEE